MILYCLSFARCFYKSCMHRQRQIHTLQECIDNLQTIQNLTRSVIYMPQTLIHKEFEFPHVIVYARGVNSRSNSLLHSFITIMTTIYIREAGNLSTINNFCIKIFHNHTYYYISLLSYPHTTVLYTSTVIKGILYPARA